MSDDEDPYAVSSDSEDEAPRKPIKIEGAVAVSALKSALAEQTKEVKKEVDEELLQLKEKKGDLVKMKKDFEQGNIKKEDEAEETEAAKAAREERQKLTEIGKEKYSKFKDRFENLDTTLGENLDERLKTIERDMAGLDKETLKSAKERFEKGLEEGSTVEKEKIEVCRSDADKKRILSTFGKPEMTADEAPKECAVCGKIVYPVEKIFANKHLYHKNCFKCAKCEKKLTATNYNSHEGVLLCKVHMLAVFHPEVALTMDPANTEEDERHRDDDDDEDFAVSSKPKQLNANVVRGGGREDDLSMLKSLKEKKKEWDSAVEEAAAVEKNKIELEIEAGRVRANKDKILAGGANEEEEDEDEEGRNPDIIREGKKGKKEELKFDVGDVKNKWKTGQVETAEQKESSEKKELEELKGGTSLKERFQERSEADSVAERKWDRTELDTSGAAEARRSFLEGAAFASSNVSKTASDLDELQFAQLKGFKERFEKGEDFSESKDELARQAMDIAVDLSNLKAAFTGKTDEEMSPEERAALKKKEIEAEFIRYKLARKAAAQRAAEEGGESGLGNADVGNIKDRFDKGDAFKGETGEKGQLDVEIKMAGKAREKFQQIDAAGATPVMPGQNKKVESSKWDKKSDAPAPECINRRNVEQDDEEEDDDAFDVKNLMNKFKNIGGDAAPKEMSAEQKAELEAIRAETRNLKDRFEKGEEQEDNDEKKRAMQEEFERLRVEREEAKRKLEEELANEEKVETKEEIGIAADHASKMAAKWEKIQKKEAKKAEKTRVPTKSSANE